MDPKVDRLGDVEIKVLDVATPQIYSLHFKEDGEHFYVLLEIIGGGNVLLRQILVLHSGELILLDRTLDDDTIRHVRERIAGFSAGRQVKTWKDVLVDAVFDDVLFPDPRARRTSRLEK